MELQKATNFGPSNLNSSWGVTNLKVVKINFVWTINNFTSMTRPGAHIHSPEFYEPETRSKWCLHACPVEYANPNYLGVYVMLKHCWLPLSVKFQFFLLNERRGIAYTGWIAEADFSNGTSLGFCNFIERIRLFNQAYSLLPNDSITILCDLKITTGLVNTVNPSKALMPALPASNNFSKEDVGNDFYSLWESGQYSDITLFIHGKTYPAHKFVLAARSSYFKDMFDKHAADGNNLHLLQVFNEFSTEEALEILRFIYTGKVENLQKHLSALTTAAEKYNLTGLKLMTKSTPMNALTFYSSGNSNNNVKLNGNAVEFYPSKAKQESYSSKHSNIKMSSPDLITEIFDKVVDGNASVETANSSSDSSLNTSSINSSSTSTPKALEWKKSPVRSDPDKNSYFHENVPGIRCLGDFLKL